MAAGFLLGSGEYGAREGGFQKSQMSTSLPSIKPMQYLGHTSSSKLLIVHLKFKFKSLSLFFIIGYDFGKLPS